MNGKTAPLWVGSMLWDPDRTPPERGPAVCLASEVDAGLLLALLLDHASAWDGPVAA